MGALNALNDSNKLMNALLLFCEPKHVSLVFLPPETLTHSVEAISFHLFHHRRIAGWLLYAYMRAILAWPRTFKTNPKCCQCHITINTLNLVSSTYSKLLITVIWHCFRLSCMRTIADRVYVCAARIDSMF